MNLIDVTRELGTEEECFAFLDKHFVLLGT
jgi:hypothetical protein